MRSDVNAVSIPMALTAWMALMRSGATTSVFSPMWAQTGQSDWRWDSSTTSAGMMRSFGLFMMYFLLII